MGIFVVAGAQAQHAHDDSASLYYVDNPRVIDPEFALRLAAALVRAKDQGILSGTEYSHISSSFRSVEYQAKLHDEYQRKKRERRPTQYAMEPATRSEHSAAMAADLGDIDPFANPGVMSRLAVVLLEQGLYFPLLNDPVHIEVHPTSKLAERAAGNYFTVFHLLPPERLPYTSQLSALKASASKMRERVGLFRRDNKALSARTSQLLDKLIVDVSAAEKANLGPAEIEAAALVSPLLEDMYALYKAQRLPRSFSAREAARLLGLKGGLGLDLAASRVPLENVASLNRKRDAVAKTGGWQMLRPVPVGSSTSVVKSDERWGGYLMGHPEMWRGGNLSDNMLKSDIKAERQRLGQNEQRARVDFGDHMTVFERDKKTGNPLGPVLDGGPGEKIRGQRGEDDDK